MKPFRFIPYLFMAVAIGTTMSCNDEENITAPAEITILNQDLLFGPASRTGFLELESTEGVDVEISSDWCHAEIERNIIYVTVDDNPGYEGRTAVLSLSAADEQKQVPIQQRGVASTELPISSIHASNAGETRTIYLRHDFEVELVSHNDWIEASMQGDSLYVTVQPNNTYGIRRGTLTYASNGTTTNLDVVQYDLAANVLGVYYFGGLMGDADMGIRFSLIERDGHLYADWTNHEGWDNAVFPVDFDEATCTLTLHSYMLFQEDKDGYEIGFFVSSDGNLGQSRTITMKAYLFQNIFYETTYATLEDTGSWPGQTLSAFTIIMSRAGGLFTQPMVTLQDPYIVRIGLLP